MTPSSTSHTPPKTTGAQRARKRLIEKLKAQPPMLPTRPSRQLRPRHLQPRLDRRGDRRAGR